jgi:F-type H+-transporting ATPase subunit epsilon
MAADGLQLEVVTLEREVIRDAASEVQLPGAAGFLGVLPRHTPLLTEVGTGVLSYHKGGQIYYAAVSGGIAEVLGDRVTVLADAAERAEEIDVDRAQKALAAAQEKYAAGASDPAAAQRAVARARTRLEAAQHAVARAHAA